jgi:hypothetical protein
MAHITSIGAGIYSTLAIHFGTSASTDVALPASPTVYGSWDDKFTTAADTASATQFKLINNIREFPSIGTPPNIVNVPVYGQAQSQQVQGQSDAPNLEVTINYVPADWAAGTILGDAVADGVIHAFRFTLANADTNGADGSVGASVMTVPNTQFFWLGKIEALLVNPQLTDANTATLTLSVQSDFYGAFTTA